MRFARDQGADQTKMEEFEARYEGTKVRQPYISLDTLQNMLVRGEVDANAISRELNAAPPFIKPDQEASWRAAWFGLRRSDAEYEAALRAVEESFRTREYSERGIVLHIVGIQLWAAEIGALRRSKSTILKKSKAYLRDLSRRGRFDIKSPSDGFSDTGYDGLGFMAGDTPEFQAFVTYYNMTQAEAERKALPARARDLLSTMVADATLFARSIYPNNVGPSTYWDKPVFTVVPPKDFVDALLSLSPDGQFSAMSGLKQRYEYNSPLAEELPWLVAVERAVSSRIRRMHPLSKHRAAGFVATLKSAQGALRGRVQ